MPNYNETPVELAERIVKLKRSISLSEVTQDVRGLKDSKRMLRNALARARRKSGYTADLLAKAAKRLDIKKQREEILESQTELLNLINALLFWWAQEEPDEFAVELGMNTNLEPTTLFESSDDEMLELWFALCKELKGHKSLAKILDILSTMFSYIKYDIINKVDLPDLPPE